ncbi:hypothetical protein [Phormidium sp. FACHB-1136]|uniref:hypothetical protein n=1 Tax=Phormidium sp. FACHB-1136 TaxID=2692848 RepID=UPI00168783FA|nr:hypothetical protein [Phormidium sp. FACHB-1136]MBD2425248.1 hypothetical protein [Phormidium sp. FACHB-1136]
MTEKTGTWPMTEDEARLGAVEDLLVKALLDIAALEQKLECYRMTLVQHNIELEAAKGRIDDLEEAHL